MMGFGFCVSFLRFLGAPLASVGEAAAAVASEGIGATGWAPFMVDDYGLSFVLSCRERGVVRVGADSRVIYVARGEAANSNNKRSEARLSPLLWIAVILCKRR